MASMSMSRLLAFDSPTRVALVLALTLLSSAGCGDGGGGPEPNDCDGCGGPPPPSTESTCVAGSAPSASPALVLGVMDGGTFAPLAGGESVTMHYGGQGGTHFEIAAQLHTGDEQLWTCLLYTSPSPRDS